MRLAVLLVAVAFLLVFTFCVCRHCSVVAIACSMFSPQTTGRLYFAQLRSFACSHLYMTLFVSASALVHEGYMLKKGKATLIGKEWFVV